MSAARSRVLTLEEYLSRSEPIDGRDELIEGELVISPSAFPDHMEVAYRIQSLIERCLERTGYVVRQDTSILVERADPASMPRPDVFVIPEAQWRDCVRERKWPEGSPILAIEVFSPSNRRSTFRKKVDLYLRNGSAAVWVVYPVTKIVQVCTLDGDKEFRHDEAIPLPAPLPSRELSVAEIFETLA